jgi:membrane protease YdiL (CAAX protease family)
MTIPRFFALVLILSLNYWKWKSCCFNFNVQYKNSSLIYSIALILIYVFEYSGYTGPFWPTSLIMLGIIATPFVGFLEEYAFRGALLFSLAQVTTKMNAVWISSFIFMLFHYQAQHVKGWPCIFLTGIILANLRMNGLGLLGLAVIHIIIDTMFFFFRLTSPNFFSLHTFIVLLALSACSFLTWYSWASNEKNETTKYAKIN